MKSVPAFRWKNGELYGLSVNGESGNDTEYMYIHLEKRAMKLPPEIENEDSFMIIPNEFVKDHELTQEEITALMTPDPEYEAEARRKYKKIPFPVRVKNFLKASFRGKINRIERILRRRWNILTGHKLVSMWPYEHPDQY